MNFAQPLCEKHINYQKIDLRQLKRQLKKILLSMNNCILIFLSLYIPYQANSQRRQIFFTNLRFIILGFWVFLQNPQFENFTTYVIFAHLLRQIAALTDQDHHFLVHWMKGYTKIVYDYKSFIFAHLSHAYKFIQTSGYLHLICAYVKKLRYRRHKKLCVILESHSSADLYLSTSLNY